MLRDWDFEFSVTTRFSSIDRIYDHLNMWMQFWPLLQAENDNRDFSANEILLIAHVLICGEEQVETCFFCGSQEIAIAQGGPPLLGGCANEMSLQVWTNGYRSGLIEEYLHLGL